jgi:hypothetical protein
VNERGYPEINGDAVTKGKWELGEPHFITQGLPLDLLPKEIRADRSINTKHRELS